MPATPTLYLSFKTTKFECLYFTAVIFFILFYWFWDVVMTGYESFHLGFNIGGSFLKKKKKMSEEWKLFPPDFLFDCKVYCKIFYGFSKKKVQHGVCCGREVHSQQCITNCMAIFVLIKGYFQLCNWVCFEVPIKFLK